MPALIEKTRVLNHTRHTHTHTHAVLVRESTMRFCVSYRPREEGIGRQRERKIDRGREVNIYIPVDRLNGGLTKPEHHVNSIVARGRLNVTRQGCGAPEDCAHVDRCHCAHTKQRYQRYTPEQRAKAPVNVLQVSLTTIIAIFMGKCTERVISLVYLYMMCFAMRFVILFGSRIVCVERES